MALVLSDLGLTRDDPRIAKTAEAFFKEWMDDKKENIFKDEVCIVGNTARYMTRFGYYDDPRVRTLFDRLLEDQKEDGGWHCWDPAKGTLDCWEALAAFAAIPKKRPDQKDQGLDRARSRVLPGTEALRRRRARSTAPGSDCTIRSITTTTSWWG